MWIKTTKQLLFLRSWRSLRCCSNSLSSSESNTNNALKPVKSSLESKVETEKRTLYPPMPDSAKKIVPGVYIDKDGAICIVPSSGYENPHESLFPFTPCYRPNPPAPRPRKTFQEIMAEKEKEIKPIWTEASKEEIAERVRRWNVRTIEVVDPNVPLTVPIMSDQYGLVVQTNNRPGEPLIKHEGEPITNWFPKSKKNVAYHLQRKIRRAESLLTASGIRYEIKWRKYDQYVKNQQFIDARFYILGPDLAAAHFLVFRGASVKFSNKNEFYCDENGSSLPSSYDGEWKIEEINASGLPLVYEGLLNLRGLKCIKRLNLSNCEYIDDWCLDRLSGKFSESLESINLSGCPKITSRGIASLSKLKKLKHVELGNREASKEFHLTCILLEELRDDDLLIGDVKVNDQILLDDRLNGNPDDGPEVKVNVKEFDLELEKSIRSDLADETQRERISG